MIPYGRQDVTREDVDAVKAVLESDFLTQGPVVPRFEAAVAEKVGARFSVAVNSATSALHLACIALGLSEGDRLWTSAITFVASANCGVYCGAAVDFVDIDPKTYNMCPAALERKLEQASREGRLPSVVVAVHMCGQSCDMEAIGELAERYGFRVIEDASHAIGGRYKGQFIGSCVYSDITVFSFHPVKIITTGEGGVAVTNDAQLHERMARCRSHGITRNPEEMEREPDGSWYYEQIEIGYNYRMTEMQAALGLSQLSRLDGYVKARKTLAERYSDCLLGLPVFIPYQAEDGLSSWHLYVIRIDHRALQVSHKELFEGMRSLGIGVNLHYIPVHLQPYYRRMGFSLGDFPESERYYQEAMSLPLYPNLSHSQQDAVIQALRDVLGAE